MILIRLDKLIEIQYEYRRQFPLRRLFLYFPRLPLYENMLCVFRKSFIYFILS